MPVLVTSNTDVSRPCPRRFLQRPLVVEKLVAVTGAIHIFVRRDVEHRARQVPNRATIGGKVVTTVMAPVPVQVTVPALVRVFCKVLPALPLMLSIPLLVTVSGSPIKVPPAQLNWPLIVTGAERLIVPLLKLTVSLEPGNPVGLQLFVLNQSVEAAPVHVKVAA